MTLSKHAWPWLAWLPLAAGPAWAQPDSLHFDPARVPVGQLREYSKSNLDGSHATRISVYMSGADRVESLKWDQGGDEATLVIGEMDWSRFSIRRFESWRLARGVAPEKRATLEVIGDRMTASFLPSPLALTRWPWHSYDFDFTSLGLTLPHLARPEDGFAFWRTDFVYVDPPRIAELGEVTLRFERIESRDGRRVRRYSIGGAGLEGRQGTWWSDARSGLLVAFELPIGDEPGYRDVRMVLEAERPLTAAEWTDLKQRAVGD